MYRTDEVGTFNPEAPTTRARVMGTLKLKATSAKSDDTTPLVMRRRRRRRRHMVARAI